MIIQRPMLWCAAALAVGIAIGLLFPLPYYYLPLLAIALIACTLLRKSSLWYEGLTLFVWLLIGSSRAAVYPICDTKPAWEQTIERESKSVQTSLIKRLEKSGLSPRTMAICKAIVLGQKDDLKRKTRQAYARVGASHLLALSGMHLGILYTVLYFLVIRWVRFSRWRWHALPIILLCLWGYAMVAGMPVSLVRAALMLSVFTVMSFIGYDTDPLHPLALSATIILLIKPTELQSISFQLSFTAVFFLLALWSPLSNRFPKLFWGTKALAVSCIATLGTMPLTLYYFHQLPLLGPLLSPLLILLTTIIIYLTLAALLLPVKPIGWLLNGVESLQQHLIDKTGDIPYATQSDIYPSATAVVLIYAVLLLAIIRLRTRQ